MDEQALEFLLSTLSIIGGAVGLVTAILFLFGPKAINSLSKILDRTRSQLDLEKILRTKARIILGVFLLIISLFMLGVAIRF